MITRTTTRKTVEDKGKDNPEIFREEVLHELRIFGIRVFRSSELYECDEKESVTKPSKIGFKK